jgi:hypothetical protein
MYFCVVETTYYGARPTGKKLPVDEKHMSFLDIDEPREKYVSQLALFRSRMSPESFWRNAWKPVPLIAFPAVLFSTVGKYLLREVHSNSTLTSRSVRQLLHLAAHHLRPQC